MQTLKTNIYLKIGVILVIGLLLLIPTAMIKSLIHERELIQKEAIDEVSSKWGEEQTILGPFITIPYFKYVKEFSRKDSTERIVKQKEFIHILPAELNISGTVLPEARYRGIYEIVVYNSRINFKGKFSKFNFSELEIPLQNIQFDKAHLTVGISDLRGIEEQKNLKWNDHELLFNPGVVTNDIVGSGINSPIIVNPNDSLDYNFSLALDIKGSQLLYFTPVGKITDVNISSGWKNPSFNGAFLPDKRIISDTGFSAKWNILHLNRNYPQAWIGAKYSIRESAFGIDLILPVDNYQKSYRSIQYAILFIAFTFLVFFFIEVLNKVFIHPIQYILIGMALVIFYTLLISISEHLKYNIAFVISALATICLIVGYTKAILKSNQLAFLISGILFVLYSFIFIVIQLQDFALLIGSVGIFIILSLVMFFSRKIDWYNLSKKKEDKPVST